MQLKHTILLFSLSIVIGVFSSCSREKNTDGKRLYVEKCLNCHQEFGEGVGKLIPPLTDQAFLKSNRNQLSCMIEHGINQPLRINEVTYNEKMKGIQGLTDADLVNILNYIGQNWGNHLETFTIVEVKEQREQCK